MDHINITQVCVYCLRGKKVFRVDLDLYDAEGKLLPGTRRMKIFDFTCDYCCLQSSLDFDKFSHQDVISHLKRLHKQYTEIDEALDQLLIILNKTI